MALPQRRISSELELARTQFFQLVNQKYPHIAHKTITDDLLAQWIRKELVERQSFIHIGIIQAARTKRQETEYFFRV